MRSANSTLLISQQLDSHRENLTIVHEYVFFRPGGGGGGRDPRKAGWGGGGDKAGGGGVTEKLKTEHHLS